MAFFALFFLHKSKCASSFAGQNMYRGQEYLFRLPLQFRVERVMNILSFYKLKGVVELED